MAEPVAMADMFQKTETCKKVVYFNICPQCGVKTENEIELPSWASTILAGGPMRGLCDECSKKNKREECRVNQEKRMSELIKHASIPPNFQEWNAKIGNNMLARKIRDHRQLNLFVSGPNNCGKTRATAFNLLLEVKSGLWCKFIRFSELAAGYARICKTSSELSMDYILDLLNESILLIDDIGKRRITETAGEMLYEIFDRILGGDGNCRVWVTSNLALQELADRFENADIGDGVVSRIDRMIESGSMIKLEEK